MKSGDNKIYSNNGTEVFIRSRVRHIKQNDNESKAHSYQPEYERLGIKPTVRDVNRDEFLIQRNRVKVARPAVKEPVVVPKQSFVQSGQHHEIIWNKPYTPKGQELIHDDEIPLPPEYEEEIVDDIDYSEPVSSEEAGDFNLDELEGGSYVLLFGQEIVQVGSKSEIEKALERLLLTSENSEEVYSKLTVLKKMNIITGVFIE